MKEGLKTCIRRVIDKPIGEGFAANRTLIPASFFNQDRQQGGSRVACRINEVELKEETRRKRIEKFLFLNLGGGKEVGVRTREGPTFSTVE